MSAGGATTRKARRPPLPGDGLDVTKMPAYWLLARLGKRILRPGGRKLSAAMLGQLAIGPTSRVVELAPGVGGTTRAIITRRPESYVGVERDATAAGVVQNLLAGTSYEARTAHAEQTGLADAEATTVVGEAFLTMQPDAAKRAIIDEAFRLLEPGGRYGIHELALQPDSLSDERQEQIRADLGSRLHFGARPLTVADWRSLLEQAGFVVDWHQTAPMALLKPARLISDEGLARAVVIAVRSVRSRAIRARMRQIRNGFRLLGDDMCAVSFAAHKPS